jgi:hypothetical protein
MNTVLAIATLCQLHLGARDFPSYDKVRHIQNQCQKELAKCLLDKTGSFKYNAEKDLLKCITKRK